MGGTSYSQLAINGKKNLLQPQLRSNSKTCLMGYLPIFVALLGLVVLYTVYTYNLIKPRKAKLTKVIDSMAENSRNRKGLILKQVEVDPVSTLKDAADMLRKTSTDRFQSFKKEEDIISTINSALVGIEHTELKKQLEEMNNTQEALIKQLHSAIQQYNDFISKAPASFVASVFGFRKF